jgi:hypothetical protein
MDLTELLTNPLVWGVLAWLFSRFFTSNKKDEETPKKQPNQRENRPNPRPNPRQSSRQSSRQNPRQNPKPVMTTVEKKSRNEAKPALQTVQQAYESMKNQTTEKIEKTRIVKEQPKKTKVVLNEQFPKVNRNIKQNNLIIDQQKAVQGVIWGEILGPPRSKNPHYTRNKRHS